MSRPFLESKRPIKDAKGCEIVNSSVFFLPPHKNWLAACLSLSVGTLFLLAVPVGAKAADIDWQGLNLTPQQSVQMDNLEGDWQKVHHEVMGQISRDMAELKTILPTGDSQRIRALQSRIMTNRTYLMKESMDTFLKKREMLSPGQRAQLQRMLPCCRNASATGPAAAKPAAVSAPVTVSEPAQAAPQSEAAPAAPAKQQAE